REDCFNRRVGNLLLLEAANDFDDHGAAALVVAAEHRGAVGANNVAFDNRLDPFAGNDGVHVGRHHDRLRVPDGAGKSCDDIPGVAADGFARAVDLDLRAHLFAVLLDTLRDLAFFARVAIDLHEFE